MFNSRQDEPWHRNELSERLTTFTMEIESLYYYILQNYDRAVKALNSIDVNRLDDTESFEMLMRLEQTKHQVENHVGSATEAFKCIWEMAE
jgi:hypothetical protein